jgi:hypothetical protein
MEVALVAIEPRKGVASAIELGEFKLVRLWMEIATGVVFLLGAQAATSIRAAIGFLQLALNACQCNVKSGLLLTLIVQRFLSWASGMGCIGRTMSSMTFNHRTTSASVTSSSAPVPAMIVEDALMVGCEPRSLSTKLSRTGEEYELDGTLLRKRYLNEVGGRGPGPRRRKGVIRPQAWPRFPESNRELGLLA